MVFRLSGVFFLVFAVSVACSAAKRNPDIEPYAIFIAGCSLLQRAPMARQAALKASCYRKLQTITGISTKEMLAFLEGIRNDPKKCMEVYEIMQSVFSESPDTLKQ